MLSFLSACSGYDVKNLAKSDVNLVTDEFIAETRSLVIELMVKLYGRNPDQLRRGKINTVEGRLAQLRDAPTSLGFSELGNVQEIAALNRVFNPSFTGDRVFLLIVGLGGMLRRAYGYNTESYISISSNTMCLKPARATPNSCLAPEKQSATRWSTLSHHQRVPRQSRQSQL